MLESYIAPLFTGYVDKYIKNLKPEDLSLSLWGGDVVLNNLEINLDVLQQVLIPNFMQVAISTGSGSPCRTVWLSLSLHVIVAREEAEFSLNIL